MSSKIKYLHYRTFDKDGRPSARGGATIAYTDGTGEPIRFATAYCRDALQDRKAGGKSDNFNRRIGRLIAKGRLLKGVNVEESNETEEDFLMNMDKFMAVTSGYYRRRRDTIIMQEEVLPSA